MEMLLAFRSVTELCRLETASALEESVCCSEVAAA